MATVGDNIRYLRKQRRMSQADLAREAKMTQSTISGIETGKQNPSMTSVTVIAGALHVNPTVLMEDRQAYYPDDIPIELHMMMEKMNEAEMQRMMDFAAGLLAARLPESESEAE